MSTPDSIGALSSPAVGSSDTTPVINEALEPASVRNGSAAVKQDYESALSFERVLVNQLAQQLVSSSGLSGDSSDSDSTADSPSDSGSSDPVVSDMSSLIPGALTNAIMSDGGLGLAAELLPSLEGTTSSSTTTSSTTTSNGTASAQGGTQAS